MIDGGFSIGMIFAYMAYKGQFLARFTSLVDQGVALRMLGLHLERISDIAMSPEDAGLSVTDIEKRDLLGRIEFQNVSYRYSPSEPLVLDNVNLVVEPGDHVALTGKSGCGKSTLVKIALGLINPTSGQVLVDSVPLAEFGHVNFRNQVAAVLQEDTLFADTLADNIALFDDDPDGAFIIECAKATAIHDDIIAMPMRYDTLVGDMGSTLSGGQRQRVLLARSLYRRPKLLVVDEGTSHLDPAREAAVNEAIRLLGITRLIIAHRSETLASARQVYLLSASGLSLFGEANH